MARIQERDTCPGVSKDVTVLIDENNPTKVKQVRLGEAKKKKKAL